MPLIDMPLDALMTYQGRNPRPDDFDEFWDRSIAEMKSIDPQVEMIPHKSGADDIEFFDLFWTGVGGARIHAKYMRPAGDSTPHPAVVIFHGYSGHSGDFFGHLGWVAAGYSVAAIDVRGQGGASQDTGITTGTTLRGHIIRGLDDSPENLLFRSIYLDCAQLAGIVMDMPEVDESRVGCTGGSQGGGLTLACAALEPRVKLAAPIYPFLCDYRRVWEMDLAVAAYEEIRTYFRQFDANHERTDAIFTKLGYIDAQFLAPRIKARTLMLTGMMDTVCPPSTQFAAYNRITAPKDVVIYPDYGHEGLPGGSDKVFEFMMGL
ncbi:MAG: acetylxylan esterase [Armatimonadetes bacterium]|nr:acetylxylan esterase [Armatimonadota bacterium]